MGAKCHPATDAGELSSGCPAGELPAGVIAGEVVRVVSQVFGAELVKELERAGVS